MRNKITLTISILSILATLVLILIINKIPYLNLIDDEMILLSSFISIFLITFLGKIDFKKLILGSILLFCIAFIFTVLKKNFYAETTGNILYILLGMALVRELFHILRNRNVVSESTSKTIHKVEPSNSKKKKVLTHSL
jgi:hypothetical protein